MHKPETEGKVCGERPADVTVEAKINSEKENTEPAGSLTPNSSPAVTFSWLLHTVGSV